MLYDGAIRFMQQAKEAIKENRIEDRYNLLVRASEIVLGLQSCLDFDAGDTVAKTLHDYYSAIDHKILSIHRTQSQEACELIIKELKDMREVWAKIDNEGASGAKPANSAESSAAVTSQPIPAKPPETPTVQVSA